MALETKLVNNARPLFSTSPRCPVGSDSMAAEEEKDNPLLVYVLSGKRKSGKDFVAARLSNAFEEDICVTLIRLSEPLKYEYARVHGLCFDDLLGSSSYKERYRADMIRWGDDKRKTDPQYFCLLATYLPLRGQQANQMECTVKEHRKIKKVWIVSDARRKTELRYFEERYNVISVRVNASEKVRTGRGWTFHIGVDDSESECGLDDMVFDMVLQNDGDDVDFQKSIKSLVDKGSVYLKNTFS